MNNFTNWERLGLKDYFSSEAATGIALDVAKIVSKNMLSPTDDTGKTKHSPFETV